MDQQNREKNAMLGIDVLMWRVFKLFLKNKKQILEQLGLTCSQFEILSAIQYLLNVIPEIIQVDLSERTAIDPMTTSMILRNLQKKGLVTRHRSTVNTRAVIVEITEKGTKLLEKAYRRMKIQSKLIYRDVDERCLTSQLVKISEKLNKLNKLNN